MKLRKVKTLHDGKQVLVLREPFSTERKILIGHVFKYRDNKANINIIGNKTKALPYNSDELYEIVDNNGNLLPDEEWGSNLDKL